MLNVRKKIKGIYQRYQENKNILKPIKNVVVVSDIGQEIDFRGDLKNIRKFLKQNYGIKMSRKVSIDIIDPYSDPEFLKKEGHAYDMAYIVDQPKKDGFITGSYNVSFDNDQNMVSDQTFKIETSPTSQSWHQVIKDGSVPVVCTLGSDRSIGPDFLESEQLMTIQYPGSKPSNAASVMYENSQKGNMHDWTGILVTEQFAENYQKKTGKPLQKALKI